MCGFCGIADLCGAPVAEETLRRMTARIRHRGPDDVGVLAAPGIGLGHARLSIIDLSSAGHQPMCTDDGALAIAYNGEVYNFAALRDELAAAGTRFRSRTDTEVVLRGYARWGTGVFARLNGMFALALWDARARRLVLARDRFGIKPLFYHRAGPRLVFGSEIKALLASGQVERRVDPAGLHEYLWYGQAHGGRTLYGGIHELPPGHWLQADAGGVRTEAFWRPEAVASRADGLDQATTRVRELLDAAVERHLVADVPVGVFLSGGIDSSAITALASRRLGGRLKTFSVGFDFDRGINELPRARRVAEHFGTEHHELHVAGGELRDVVTALVRAHDQPFADAANIPLYLLCARVRDDVKVVLQGDGGDEIFAGYRRYNVLSAERAWRLVARAGTALRGVAPDNARAARLFRFLDALAEPDPAMRMAMLLTVETRREPPTALLGPAFREMVEGTDPFAAYRDAARRFGGLDPVQRMLYTDTQVLLPSQFLEKVDRATMAHGVEVRVPFLDAELAEYVMGLPSARKVRRGQKKWILRRALRGIVPDEVLDGPKTGFGVPYEHWLRTSLRGFLEEVVTDPSVARAGLFDPAVLRRRIDDHVSGRRDHGFLLWKALHLALWHREYLDGR